MVHIPLLWQKPALSGSLERLVEVVVSGRDRLAAGAIVPVPLYRQRRRERGSLEERWESVGGAFATRPGSQVDNLRFLLADGVLRPEQPWMPLCEPYGKQAQSQ